MAGQRLGEGLGGFDGEGGEVQVPKVDKGPPPLAPRLCPGWEGRVGGVRGTDAADEGWRCAVTGATDDGSLPTRAPAQVGCTKYLPVPPIPPTR